VMPTPRRTGVLPRAFSSVLLSRKVGNLLADAQNPPLSYSLGLFPPVLFLEGSFLSSGLCWAPTLVNKCSSYLPTAGKALVSSRELSLPSRATTFFPSVQFFLARVVFLQESGGSRLLFFLLALFLTPPTLLSNFFLFTPT